MLYASDAHSTIRPLYKAFIVSRHLILNTILNTALNTILITFSSITNQTKMQLFATILLALTPSAIAAPTAGQTEHRTALANGFYLSKVNADGTVTHTPVNDPSELASLQGASAFSRRAPTKPTVGLDKRFVSCWGRQLDNAGTDKAVNQWKSYLSTTLLELRSSGTPYYVQYINDGVTVYYCINAKNSVGSLSLEDFNYALVQMDATCRRYEAGYHQWDGSPEIVGKASVNDRVCLG